MISQERLRPYLLDNITDGVLVKRIKKIQELYTVKRDDLKHIAWDEQDVSSYTAFYLATNYPKFSFLLDKLPDDFFDTKTPHDFIDFGTGPGTYLLSYLDRVGHESAHKLYAIDRNKMMLKQAEKLLVGLHPKAQDKLIFTETMNDISGEHSRILLFGHSMNELQLSDFKKIIKTIRPTKILFLEPGTPYVFEQMLQVREFLKTQNFDCLYPCLSIEKECPMVARKELGDWCHQVWRGNHEEKTERLTQLMKIDRRSMPLIAHAYAISSEPQIVFEQAQMVRYLKELKHAYVWQVCLFVENELELCEFEIPKKSMSKQELKEFKKIGVGERVDYTVIKKIDSHKWRVSIVLK